VAQNLPLTIAEAYDSQQEFLAWQAKNEDLPTYCQKYRLLRDLATRCTNEALARGDSIYELENRLTKAVDILDWIWGANASSETFELWNNAIGNEDEFIWKEGAKTRQTIWKRHDPRISYREGYESPHYLSVGKDQSSGVIATYLSNPWLRHPILDWMLLDVGISNELCQFGREINEITYLSATYDYHKGSLGKIRRSFAGLKRAVSDWGSPLFLAALLGAIFSYIDGKINYLPLGIFAALMAYSEIKRFFSLRKARDLWASMYEVWPLLSGPTINPSMVKDAMERSRKDGAVWDNATWALIDRVISIDAAVLTVTYDQT
jgi:hypothetical protein